MHPLIDCRNAAKSPISSSNLDKIGTSYNPILCPMMTEQLFDLRKSKKKTKQGLMGVKTVYFFSILIHLILLETVGQTCEIRSFLANWLTRINVNIKGILAIICRELCNIRWPWQPCSSMSKAMNVSLERAAMDGIDSMSGYIVALAFVWYVCPSFTVFTVSCWKFFFWKVINKLCYNINHIKLKIEIL